MINYFLQSVVLRGFDSSTGFFLFRLNDSILIKFLLFKGFFFFRNAFIWKILVALVAVFFRQCDDSLLCFVTPGPAILHCFLTKSDLQMPIRRKELSLNLSYINCWESSAVSQSWFFRRRYNSFCISWDKWVFGLERDVTNFSVTQSSNCSVLFHFSSASFIRQ